MAQLPLGDLTEIGEKGITLSGGQKQRTAIARAVYADADLVVMDDPLSALDAHVAKDLFRKCLQVEGAFKDKAVLLVTHQLQFVHQADHVVVMADGAIVERGAYDELVRREGGAFKQLMESYHGEDEGTRRASERLRNAPREGGRPTPVPAAARDAEEEERGTRGGSHRRGDRVGGGGAGRRPGHVSGAPRRSGARSLADRSRRGPPGRVRDAKRRAGKENTMTEEKFDRKARCSLQRTYLDVHHARWARRRSSCRLAHDGHRRASSLSVDVVRVARVLVRASTGRT